MQFLKRFTTKEAPVEHFFALNLSEEAVRGAVWSVRDGQARIVKLGPGESWDGKTKESLLKAADQSLSVASEGIKPEPDGVVFGLPEAWIENDSVAGERKPFLKHLCEQLVLKPLGFVVTDTALIAYFKTEEGMPVSAILIQLTAAEINLALVKLGKIVGSQLVGRSGDLGADVEEGLSRFDKVDALPARIILYNGNGDFEEDKQQLLSYDWEDKLPFIHFPKVETINSEITVKAVALAGGSEVAQSLGIEIKPADVAESTAASLGFSAGEDAAKAEPEPEAPAEPEPIADAEPVALPVKKSPKFKFNLGPVKKKIGSVLAKLPRSRWPVILGGGLAGLVILLFLLYWYVPKAGVVIYLEPQVVNQELEIKLDPDAAVISESGPVLPVRLVETSVSGSRTAAVSGSKTIGDPAQGEVTLFNKTAAAKTFAAAAMLLGPDNLAFTLDEETTVASRSAEEDSDGVITITPGKADAKITAVNIGPESNLAADTRLSFKQFSQDDYYAKSSGLSGGTAREVKAVAKEDLDNLESALLRELIDQAKTELARSLSDDQEVIGREEVLALAKKEFNHQADEAADELGLSGELDYSGIVYRRPELDLLLQSAIKSKIPENFLVSEFSRRELGAVTGMNLPVSFEVKLLPRLEFSELKNNLRGRYPETVEAYLVTLPQFVRADIKITPPLLRALKTLPRLVKNISVEVKPAP